MHPTVTFRKIGGQSFCVLLTSALVACAAGSGKNETSPTNPSPLVAPAASTTIAAGAASATTAVTAVGTTFASTIVAASKVSTTPLPPAKTEVETKLRALYQDAEKALRTCIENPAACDRAGLLSRFVDPARSQYDELLAERIVKDVRTRSPGPDKDYFVVTSVTVSDDLSGGAVLSCTYDGRVQYKPAKTGGTEEIVDASVSSYRQIWNFNLDASGAYRVDAVTLEGNLKSKDKNVCPPPA